MGDPIPFMTVGEVARELAIIGAQSTALLIGLSLAAGFVASPPAFIALALWTLH